VPVIIVQYIYMYIVHVYKLLHDISYYSYKYTNNCIELFERLHCTIEQVKVNCRNKSEFYLSFIKAKHMLTHLQMFQLCLQEIYYTRVY